MDDKRKEKRFKENFVIHFRGMSDNEWDAVIPVNVSQSALCFNTSNPYEVNSQIMVKIHNVHVGEERFYTCLVIRCEQSPKMQDSYRTVVELHSHDPDHLEEFRQFIDQMTQEDT